ncbi:type II/IV secretion system protein [Pedobacter panaciterrae]|uniref:GspE/PulE family protein n=1 Tax=Pedobacter panaciterrae TaxID=363849 RepID=UPI00155D8EA3|nr:GspE/PulE family protein [Pedobacter panaciterrae]NQX52066.1 type II/IV secretion system protein [Pedobacter panaciterrae]
MKPENSVKAELLHEITGETAWHYRIFPFDLKEGVLCMYTESAEQAVLLQDELEIVMNRKISLHPETPETLSRLLNQYYLRENHRTEMEITSNEPVSNDFLQKLISEAKKLKSSDIHIEAYEEKCRVRIRIDGMLIERYRLSISEYPAIINRIKILANLDIAEKRLPQDGRISFKTASQAFDIRVSVLPTLFGEKIVLRLLNNDTANIDLFKLGLSEPDLSAYLEGVQRPNGIVLISGPTGSGKTTTLYATLKLLNKSTRNIVTIEDPIEYTLEGINQVQLKENIGLGFASALRTFLRQDPDVIMVGEIRDPETANMAIRAALTGHLVLSTIHTNSAWGTVSRLLDMGIPAFLAANTLNTSVAQRLVRLLCPVCKSLAEFDEMGYPRSFKPFYRVDTHYLPAGCPKCYNTGFSGRKAVYEVIGMDRDLAALIKASEMNAEVVLKEKGISSLAENAFALFASGETSLEEIYPLLLN